MRPIKLRAWDLKRKEMVEVSAIDFASENILDGGGRLADMYESSHRRHFYELMQYTGLKDKDGREIYEGDIVAIDMWQGNEHGYIPEVGVIKWHDGSAAFKWFSRDSSDSNNYWLTDADSKQRVVIGNIYENPELAG